MIPESGMSSAPAEMLADGMMCNGANLQLLEDRGVALYSPIRVTDPMTNPACRPDSTQPVPEESWDKLPIAVVTVDGKKLTQMDKDAFVYDADKDCYWCPAAQKLPLATTSTEKFKMGNQVRHRYKSDATTCATCPLRERCLKRGVAVREISRFEHDHLRTELAQRISIAPCHVNDSGLMLRDGKNVNAKPERIQAACVSEFGLISFFDTSRSIPCQTRSTFSSVRHAMRLSPRCGQRLQ